MGSGYTGVAKALLGRALCGPQACLSEGWGAAVP